MTEKTDFRKASREIPFTNFSSSLNKGNRSTHLKMQGMSGGDGSTSPMVATGTYPAFITADPSGKFAYVAN